jgi:hypothetical protein
MNDPREDFSPYWFQTATPFGMAPPPTGLPKPGSGFAPINPARPAMLDWPAIPIPPALPPWFPPSPPPAHPPSPAADHLDSAKYWGAMSEPSDAAGQPPGDSRGILYSLSKPHQSPATIWDSSPWGAEAPGAGGGILGWLTLPNSPSVAQPSSDALKSSPEPATQSRSRFDLGDLTKSSGIGLAQGTISVPGIFGDVRELYAHGAQQLADYIAPGYGPTVGMAMSRGLRLLPFIGGPSSSDIRRSIESVTGPFYEPQTVAGDYARTLGEFVPGMFAPGGWARNAVRYVALPALASETAGQATQGTWAEPWARAIAAIGTAGAGAAAAGRLRRGTNAASSAEQSPYSATIAEILPITDVTAVNEPKSLRARSSGMVAPPEMPQRPISADYPSGAPAGASGRLPYDIEARPLVARYIAGRRLAGGKDEGLLPYYIFDLVTRALGRPPVREAVEKGSGIYVPAGKSTPPKLAIHDELRPGDPIHVLGHETGHMIEDLAVGAHGMPTQGLEQELGTVIQHAQSSKGATPANATSGYRLSRFRGSARTRGRSHSRLFDEPQLPQGRCSEGGGRDQGDGQLPPDAVEAHPIQHTGRRCCSRYDKGRNWRQR